MISPPKGRIRRASGAILSVVRLTSAVHTVTASKMMSRDSRRINRVAAVVSNKAIGQIPSMVSRTDLTPVTEATITPIRETTRTVAEIGIATEAMPMIIATATAEPVHGGMATVAAIDWLYRRSLTA
jgi:hypothetical protein